MRSSLTVHPRTVYYQAVCRLATNQEKANGHMHVRVVSAWPNLRTHDNEDSKECSVGSYEIGFESLSLVVLARAGWTLE